MPDKTYLETLCLYYEEEIEGEAYFAELAARFEDPGQKHKLTLLAEVERHAAQAVLPLIALHGITPRTRDELVQSGREDARRTAVDWSALIGDMKRTYPGYLAAFEALEAMGPAADQHRLSFLTEHEVAAIAFLELEGTDPARSDQPLKTYLATPPGSWRAAGQ